MVSAVVSVIVLGTHQSFEENEMHARMERFHDALNNSVFSLGNTVEDYAVWDASAQFAEGNYPEFVEAELSNESFQKMGIDIIGYYDLNGKPLFQKDFSVPPDSPDQINPETRIYMPPFDPVGDNVLSWSSDRKGIIFSHNNLSGILVYHPIVYHSMNRSPVGTIVMGRYFTENLLDELSVVLKKRVQLVQSGSVHKISPGNHPISGSEILVTTLNDSAISASLQLEDPVSNDRITFITVSSRDIYQQGLSTLATFLVLNALVMIVFTILTIIGLSYYLKHADDAHRLASEKDKSYQQIINDLEDAYFKADVDGILEEVSPSAVKMLGYSHRDELIGIRISDLFQNPDERSGLRAILFDEYQIQNHTIALKRKDGSLIFTSIHAHLISTDDGIITGMEGIVHDQTEAILIGKDKSERQSVYRLIFDSANIGLFQSTPEGRFLSVNPAFVSMLGYASPEQLRHELINNPNNLFQDSNDGDLAVEFLLQNGSIENWEIQLDKRDRTPIWLNINAVLIRDINEQPMAFFGTAIDITERKNVENELKDSQQKFKSLFYLSPIAIMVYDHQGLLVDANSMAISIFGVSDESMLSSGKLFTHPLLNISDRVKISRGISIDSDITLDYDHERSQYQFPSSRSGTGHLRIMVSPIPHPSDSDIGWYLAQVIDETERKKAEIANVVNELKYRRVFAHVSHGLILFELLADGEPGQILDMNPKAEELIQRTLNDALADVDLVQNYLDISGSYLGISRHTETGEVCTREMELQISGGGYVPVFVTFVLFRIADKKVGLAVIEDITQKKKYEEERIRMIQQIEKNLAELAILNDGIRNPLTVIMLIVDELDEAIANPVLAQIRAIDHLIDTLDKRWLESEKILQFLRKHNHAHLDMSTNDTM